MIEKFQWITAGTVFANPFPALELVANGAVQFQMISELAGVYGVQISTSHVRMIGGQMIQMLLKLGLVETATSLIAGIFKSSLVGYAAAGAVQGVSMAYLTHVSGEAFAEYFRRGQAWGDGGMQAALIRQFDLTSRAEFLQEFAKQAVQKVSTRFLHGVAQDARTARVQDLNATRRTNIMAKSPRPSLGSFPTARSDDRRHRPRTARGSNLLRRDPGRLPRTGRRMGAQSPCLGRARPRPGPRAGTHARRRAEERQGPRPLHGIPIGIKDIIDVAGLPTACGSKRWANQVADSDAEVVANLRNAGAVIMGKTVTTPYAWIDPPVTRNPWNLERTPGGSSSGSAAAVACGCAWARSARRPAARSPGRPRSAASPA